MVALPVHRDRKVKAYNLQGGLAYHSNPTYYTRYSRIGTAEPNSREQNSLGMIEELTTGEIQFQGPYLVDAQNRPSRSSLCINQSTCMCSTRTMVGLSSIAHLLYTVLEFDTCECYHEAHRLNPCEMVVCKAPPDGRNHKNTIYVFHPLLELNIIFPY